MPCRRSYTRISLPVMFLAIAAHGFAADKAPSVQAKSDALKHDDALTSMTARFLKQPNQANFTALQNRVVADHSYDQTSRGLEEMIDLYKQKHYQAALDRFKAVHARSTAQLARDTSTPRAVTKSSARRISKRRNWLSLAPACKVSWPPVTARPSGRSS